MNEFTIDTPIRSYSWDELSESDKHLVEVAKRNTQNSYSPYSHFCVGAAALLSDGTIVSGCNQENAAYPSGLCAERTVLFAAGAQHPDQPVEVLAIAAYTDGHYTEDPVSPCGACRQVMLETENRYKHPMRVLLFGANHVYEFRSAESLLPFSFISDDLKGGVRAR
ncbi:MAG: cytidine deaminase [Paludibacteraceae bacterium]|nr:cytidine deaminase [Paludibacteraceae bacterium]